MFKNCKNFNQPLNDWDLSNVTSMESMFMNCKNFNQHLNYWDVSKVTSMAFMFARCDNFNGNINDWDVSNVISMFVMFAGCTEFNQPLNDWNVSNVISMESMFAVCTNFNQPLDKWNVSNVTSMAYMFAGCKNFDQDLYDWDIENADTRNMFENCNIKKDNKPTIISDVHIRDLRRNLPPPPPRAILNQPYFPEPYFPDIVPRVELNDIFISPKEFDKIQKQIAFDPVDGDVIIGEIKEDEDKIIFEFNKSFYSITKEQIKTIYDNHNETIYGCYNADTTIIPRTENVDKKEPYFYLNKIGIISGIVQYGYIENILQSESTSKIQYYKIFPTEKQRKEWKATTTGEMLGTDPQAVGAHHCQEGTSKKIYEIHRLNVMTNLDDNSSLPPPPPQYVSSHSARLFGGKKSRKKIQKKWKTSSGKKTARNH